MLYRLQDAGIVLAFGMLAFGVMHCPNTTSRTNAIAYESESCAGHIRYIYHCIKTSYVVAWRDGASKLAAWATAFSSLPSSAASIADCRWRSEGAQRHIAAGQRRTGAGRG